MSTLKSIGLQFFAEATPDPTYPTEPPKAPETPPQAVTVDTEAITKAAAEKATEAAEKKMEAVFKSMLQQQGLDAETISKMTSEWKSNQVTPEQELKLRDDTIGTLTQQLEAERQEKAALAKGVPLGSDDEATKAKAAACITLAKSYVSADVTFEEALDKAMQIISFAPAAPEKPEVKPPMWGGAGKSSIPAISAEKQAAIDAAKKAMKIYDKKE